MDKNKKFLLIGLGVIIVALFIVLVINETKNNKGDKKDKKDSNKSSETENNNASIDKVDIIDVNSTTRPFAVVVNNTPCAVGVQEGLNKAYIVYELPTEGATSRLMALYKDVDDITVGTIRSARHNFIDFAYESNAILVAYGWSQMAEAELSGGKAIIDNMNGMVDDYPYWRNNPEGLAYEHTAYTSIAKIREYATQKGFSLTGDNTILLNYNTGDVDLSSKENVRTANHLVIPYGNIVTEFNYNADTKMYTKVVNGVNIVDYANKEAITTKNVIIEKIDYNDIQNSYNYTYWNLHDVGSGDGYYITNGKAVPIKWNKPSRSAKTTYTYLDGTEIEVSDGRTYIEVQVTSQPTTIE